MVEIKSENNHIKLTKSMEDVWDRMISMVNKKAQQIFNNDTNTLS